MIDQLPEILERQIRSDPLWAVLRMEFWLVASPDPEVRQRLVADAETYRQRTGEIIDTMLASADRTAPFTGRELGILINALATGLAIQLQHKPDAFDPKLLVRAVRRLAGLDAAAATEQPSDGDTPSPPTRPSRRVKPT